MGEGKGGERGGGEGGGWGWEDGMEGEVTRDNTCLALRVVMLLHYCQRIHTQIHCVQPHSA